MALTFLGYTIISIQRGPTPKVDCDAQGVTVSSHGCYRWPRHRVYYSIFPWNPLNRTLVASWLNRILFLPSCRATGNGYHLCTCYVGGMKTSTSLLRFGDRAIIEWLLNFFSRLLRSPITLEISAQAKGWVTRTCTTF